MMLSYIGYAPRQRLVLAAAVVAFVAMATVPAMGATRYANPGDIVKNHISAMQPGDTLIFRPGTYNNPSVTMLYIADKVGRPDAWYTLKAEQPGTVRIVGNSGKNVCEMRNSAYWRFENLELDGAGVSGDGIKCTPHTGNAQTDWNHHIVLDNLNIHHVRNACVNTQVTVWDLTIQNCWFHDTGIGSSTDNPGPGLYLGNPNHVQQIINLTLRNNLIERTAGYGMQIKAQLPRSGLTLGTTPGLEFDSWGWLIKDNVFMRTNPPAIAGRPCLLADAGPASGVGSDDMCTIEGNVVLAQTADGTTDNAFQLSGNLRVVNNILMNCKGAPAIRIGSHDGSNPRHVEVINNTVFTDGSTYAPCLSLSSLQAGYTQVIANNAFIRVSTSGVAVSASVLAGTVVTNNIVRGTGAIAGMTTITTPIGQIFTSTTDVPGTANFYPVAGSPLIDAGSDTYAPADDFNGAPRPQWAAADVGAYEYYKQDNPGWQLALERKRVGLTGDTNGDGMVDVVDLLDFVAAFGSLAGDPNYSAACDFNSDDAVDVVDLLMLVNSFGL